jgi:hypothetical protein
MVSSAMDDSSYRLNFDQGKKNEIQHHSWKERLRMSKTAKINWLLNGIK